MNLFNKIHCLAILMGLLLLPTGTITAQVTGNCKVTITTAFKGKVYTLESKEATLTLNSKSGDLILKLKLNSIDAELDTLDAYFDDKDDEMVFSGNLGSSLFDLLNIDENSGKNFPVEGTLALNQVTNKVAGNFNVFKINNERDELLRNVRFSLFLNFKARDFALNKFHPGLTGDIALQINEAVVNVEE